MKDYITTSVKPSTCASNSVLLQCPFHANKFNFSHCTPPSPIYACAVGKDTVFIEPFTYNQGVIDPR